MRRKSSLLRTSSLCRLQENGSSGTETRTRDVNPDTERLHQRLRDIAQAVITDDDSFFDDYDTGRSSPRRLSPQRGADRFDSPDRGFGR